MGDDEQRRAGRLHNGNQAPEATRERITAAGHGDTRIRLADGAADGINAAGAGAAATGDFIPVNGVLLGKADGRKQQA